MPLETLEDAVAHVEDTTTPAPAEPAPQAPPSDDPDARELAEALAAAEAEKAPVQPEANPVEPASGEAGQQPTEPESDPEPKDKGPVPMIPKPRLDEVLEQKAERERELAFLKGQLEALKGNPQASQQQPAAPPPATPEQRLAQLHQAQDELAAKFDNGEITYAELTRQTRALANQEQGIREEILVAKVKPAPAPQGDKLYLDTLTAQLEDQHPWVKEFTDDQDFNFIVEKAKASLAAKGVALDNSDMGTYRLRKEIAETASQWGPRFYPGKQVGSPATTQQPAAPSAAATARAAKLAQQESMPPDLSAVSGVPTTVNDYSPAKLEQMTDDELAALPASVKNKFLGITS